MSSIEEILAKLTCPECDQLVSQSTKQKILAECKNEQCIGHKWADNAVIKL